MQTHISNTNGRSRTSHGPATAFFTAANDYLNRPAEENLRGETIAAARHVLRKAGKRFDNPSLNTVTPSDLEAIIHNPTRPQRVNWHHYVMLRRFYRWLVENRYLPKAGSPMANIRPPKMPTLHCQILTVSEARSALRLLASGSDLKTATFLAITIFSGIRFEELEQLGPCDIQPGAQIFVRPEWSACRRPRIVPILPVLDEWLRPFYSHMQRLFSIRGRLVRVRREFDAHKLSWKRHFFRHSYCAYRLAETQDAALTAAETGLPAYLFPRHHRGLTTSSEAKQFFALSPETCGIADWNERVAAFARNIGINSNNLQ